jgi:hypothetical protein
MGNKISSIQAIEGVDDNLPHESELNNRDIFSFGSNMIRDEMCESVRPVSFEIVDKSKEYRVRRVETDYFQVQDVMKYVSLTVIVIFLSWLS